MCNRDLAVKLCYELGKGGSLAGVNAPARLQQLIAGERSSTSHTHTLAERERILTCHPCSLVACVDGCHGGDTAVAPPSCWH